MASPAEELAAEWWDKNITFRGDHTQGMYMNARDFVDLIGWCTGSDDKTTRERGIEVLTPVAQKYLDQQKEPGDIR